MRPGTFIEWDDQSQITPLQINEVREAPVFCALATTDKGPEEWTLFEGKPWFNAYGNNISYANHGQPLLQSAMAINSGAKLLFKRLVADDACLANIAVVAKIVTQQVQKTNDDGELLYDDGNGFLTTENQKVDSTGKFLYYDENNQETTQAQRHDTSNRPLYTDKNGNIVTDEQRKDNSGLLLYLDDNGVETTNKFKVDGEGNTLYIDSNGNLTTVSHKTDANGDPLYKTSDGIETTDEQKKDAYGRPLYRKTDGTEVHYPDSTTEWADTHEEGDGTVAPDPVLTYTPIMNTPVMNDHAENDPSLNKPVLNTPIYNKPAMINGASTVRYTLKTAVGIKENNVKSVADAIRQDVGEDEYLLWVICDNGRGKSKKRFKIMPNYRLSKNLKYILYAFMTIEDGEIDETVYFTPNPNQVKANENISLASIINTKSSQLKAYQDEDGLTNFINRVAEIAGVDPDTGVYDFLFCRTLKDRPLDNISVDTENYIDLQSNFGQSLQSGDNGSFGDKPWVNARDLYNEQAIRALDGTYDKVIFDVDRYFIDAMVDANYDSCVKRAIEALAIYREDFMYFRDMGLDMYTLDDVIYGDMDNVSTMFATTYCTAYDIYDPYTRKQIPVTIGYSLSRLLPVHLNNGFNIPPAGILHDFILDEAIDGTVHFLPSVYPQMDEKTELNDIRVNYASYIENKLVVETLYTSQEEYTQFSFTNNVMAIQKVIKAVRRRCPIIRYSFIDGEDLEKYKKDIQTVLDRYSAQFKVLEMVYVQDDVYVQNKIFYAVVRVCFRDFVQTEIFKITAFNQETTLS